jgi:hypothetical protein
MSDETKIQNWHAEAMKQRERAEEAEKWLATNRKHWDDEKAERQRLERVVAELTPPEGHVSVILPREVVEWAARDRRAVDYNQLHFHHACRKALEADDE